MKPLALCFLLGLAAGCAGDSRRGDLAADNRDYFAGSGPVRVEKNVEAPQLSQAAGAQVGKLQAELAALKLENGDLKARLDAEVQVNAALKQTNVQLRESVEAGRDVIQFTWVHAAGLAILVKSFVAIVIVMHRSFNARLKDVDASRARAVAREDKVRAELLEKVVRSPSPKLGGPHA